MNGWNSTTQRQDLPWYVDLTPGTYYFCVEQYGNYTGPYTFKISKVPADGESSDNPTNPVEKRNIANATVSISPQVFTGFALRPLPAVRYISSILSVNKDHTISYANNVKAGKATITISGKGSYTGTKAVTFTISKASIKNATAAKVKAQKYRKGKAVKPSPKITYKGKTLKKGTDYTLKCKNKKKRGTATITVKGKGNFKGTKTMKFRIV